jgi:DNA replication ATP-dependent helicase Dna2
MLRDDLGDRVEAIDVDTVERYQGSERDTIIVSLVKTDHAGTFLADHRRLNVTLTRARRKLILFGNRECLVMSPLFRTLIEQDETTVVSW